MSWVLPVTERLGIMSRSMSVAVTVNEVQKTICIPHHISGISMNMILLCGELKIGKILEFLEIRNLIETNNIGVGSLEEDVQSTFGNS